MAAGRAGAIIFFYAAQGRVLTCGKISNPKKILIDS
jgi:hypothetical protein